MSTDWKLIYEGLEPRREGLREALCTLGNGAFATRGAAEENAADGVHYPGTYVAGGYNALTSEVAGRTVVNEDLVNFTNWLPLTFRPMDDDGWFDLAKVEVLGYRQVLHLDEGRLSRSMRFRDARGRITRIESERLVHMAMPQLAALCWTLTAENWSGEILLRSGLDGSVTNGNVARYRQLNHAHLLPIGAGPISPEGIYLVVRTTTSRFEVACAARTRTFVGNARRRTDRRVVQDDPARIAEEIRLQLDQGQPARVEKVVAIYNLRDRGISEPGISTRMAILAAPDFDALRESQQLAWARLWRRHDVQIDAAAQPEQDPPEDQMVIRLHLFHLLQTMSPNTIGRDVGVPARGLHGEAYRGHVFWDEMFILPVWSQRMPSLVRSHLLYRYYRLDAARQIAREAGGRGACFPWQSSSDGYEATQTWHLNPLSGTWGPDFSNLQRHVNAAIVYDLWNYFEATNDRPFMSEVGAVLALEIARFWSSIARFNERTGRYDIDGVMGPDEYHEKYPGSPVGGLRNNAYTNVMAAWCLLRALEILDVVGSSRRAELLTLLNVDEQELLRWRDLTTRLAVPFHEGVISQFEGYEELKELDWAAYEKRYGDLQRLDRILKAEGDSPDRYKVSKQPDVIMLFYLFRAEEVRALLGRLGYPFDEAALSRNVDYYRARTTHGSTLSKVVFTSVVHRKSCAEGCRIFLSALRSDLYDTQGGTTAEGIHLGAMGGTVDIMLRHYAGMDVSREGIHIWPDLPERLRLLRFRFEFRGRWVDVLLADGRLRVNFVDDTGEPVPMQIQGHWYALRPGIPIELPLQRPPSWAHAHEEPGETPAAM